MHFLSVDIGSTNCKCQLFTETGEILDYRTREYLQLTVGNDVYVDIAAILENMRRLICEVTAEFFVDSLCISSFGESFVLLDGAVRLLFHPMLYTDPAGRGRRGRILPPPRRMASSSPVTNIY